MALSSTNQKLFREAIFALSISVFGGLFTGVLWSRLNEDLNILPLLAGIIALVPVIGQMRGNISGIFTSRLGTGLNLGNIKPSIRNRSQELNNTILMNVLVSLFSPIWVSIVVFLLYIVSTPVLTPVLTYYLFLSIALIAGIFSASIQILLALIVAFRIFRSGQDPDILAYPILSSTGDIITVLGILIGIYIFQNYLTLNDELIKIIIILSALLSLAIFIIIIFSRPIRSRFEFNIIHLLSESIPVIFVAAIIGAIVGIIAANIEIKVLIIILPAYMAYTGSLGAIIGSKYTTAYYLGILETNGKNSIYFQTPVILLSIGIILSTLLGIIGFKLGEILGLLPPYLDQLGFLIICWFTGLITTIFSIISSLIVGSLSFQRGIDADNVIIPLTSTFGDLVAILAIVLTATILF